MLFNFSFLHHFLVWDLIIKFLQKGIFKLYLTGVELICFTLFLHWPQVATSQENLWPFAINYVIYMHHHLSIGNMRISLTKYFTNTVFPNYIYLTRAHTFCCPVYVLDPRLQDSKKVPQWSLQSRRGIYLQVRFQPLTFAFHYIWSMIYWCCLLH